MPQTLDKLDPGDLDGLRQELARERREWIRFQAEWIRKHRLRRP